MIPFKDTIIATIYMALIIFFTRAFPFLLFSKRKPPQGIRFIEQYIPPMVMGVLVIYCLKHIEWHMWPSGIKELISIAFVTILHIWKRNAMLSIFGGTALYMLLLQLNCL